MQPPQIDSTAAVEIVVAEPDLASVLRFDSEDRFPEVFATTRMIALMEVAAARVLRPYLEGDELSVGVTVDVLHTAATLIGKRVTATARYVGQEGKHYLFEVRATDEGGEIGRGTHKRAVVSTARLVAGAERRGAGA